jgi:hypothetical protein
MPFSSVRQRYVPYGVEVLPSPRFCVLLLPGAFGYLTHLNSITFTQFRQ